LAAASSADAGAYGAAPDVRAGALSGHWRPDWRRWRRLDFDIDNPDAIDKDELTAKLQELVAADHKVSQRWITDAELDANPGLVRTMSVQPPRGSGRVRLVAIGEDGAVDLQPCGGTHVASTAEIGNISITKVEKKGRNNRRFRLALAD
jgi:misacylated tRNA(Ala) deacylase